MHAKSEYYEFGAFKAGKSSLHSMELEEVGDVAEKTACSPAMPISARIRSRGQGWARRLRGRLFGQSVAIARSLSEELGIPASFVQSDIYDLPTSLRPVRYRLHVVRHDLLAAKYEPMGAGWCRTSSSRAAPFT